jgi:stage II sporulation protein D
MNGASRLRIVAIHSMVGILLAGCQQQPAPQQSSAPAMIAANHASEPLPENGEAGDIRVALTDDPVDSITIETTSPIAVLAREGDELAALAPKLTIQIERSKAGWNVGTKSLEAKSIEFHPTSSPGLWVNDRLYRGFVRFVAEGKRSFRIINVLPLEHYIAGVIDGEMPIDFPEESRKVQAVAARSFAVMQRMRATSDSEFDLYASPLKSQHYRGYQYRDAMGATKVGESDAARRVTRETKGLVCTRNGELFRTYYSACCGGRTTKGSLYFPDASDMPGVACNACDACPKHRWSLRLNTDELSAAVRRAASDSIAKQFSVARAEAQGIDDRNRILQVTVEDAAGKKQQVTGVALRSAIGVNKLYSGWFNIHRDGDEFVLEGRGYGHGVGMCQWGAAGLAKQGSDFRTILTRYYPGCEIQPLTTLKSRPDDGANHGHGTRQYSDD